MYPPRLSTPALNPFRFPNYQGSSANTINNNNYIPPAVNNNNSANTINNNNCNLPTVNPPTATLPTVNPPSVNPTGEANGTETSVCFFILIILFK